MNDEFEAKGSPCCVMDGRIKAEIREMVLFSKPVHHNEGEYIDLLLKRVNLLMKKQMYKYNYVDYNIITIDIDLEFNGNTVVAQQVADVYNECGCEASVEPSHPFGPGIEGFSTPLLVIKW